jgi:DNA-binding transcriptional regulator YdaS (Cro superfamily)
VTQKFIPEPETPSVVRGLTEERVDAVREFLRQKVALDFEGQQKKAANAWGIGQSRLSAMLSGRDGIGLQNVTKIADYYGVSVDEVMGSGGRREVAYEPPPEAGPYEIVEASVLFRRADPAVQKAFRERRLRLPADPVLALERATAHLLSLIRDHRDGVLEVDESALIAAERKP